MSSITHWDEAERKLRAEGDIRAHWTMLGQAAGTVGAGVRRIEVEPEMRSTALHVHGAEEEIFFVLGGSGVLWEGETSCTVGAGDCTVHLAGGKPHTLRAGPDGLDVLAFGTRVSVELCYLPRAGMAWAGPTVVPAPGLESLWKRDVAAGELKIPEPGPRPSNVVAVENVAGKPVDKGGSQFSYRSLGHAAGSVRTGMDHVTIAPNAIGWPPHCHAAEEEIFVILGGEGVCRLGKDEHSVRRGHVISRPPGTGVAHSFRAGSAGMTYLAYGTREPNDIAYYPRSGKVKLRGVGVIGRIAPVEYWEGET